MRKLLLALAGAMLIWINPVQAALIQVSGDLGWSCGTGTGGFEASCVPDVERGTFSFVYNTNLVDSDPTTDRGMFVNPLTGFSMTVEQESRPDLLFTLAGTSSMSRGLYVDADHLHLTVVLAEANNVIPVSSFFFNFLICCRGVGFPNDAPTIQNYWSRSPYGLIAGSGGVGETDWLYPGSLTATVIPEPPAAFLLAVGLLALVIARRRKDRTNY